jgi:hypothetical protein
LCLCGHSYFKKYQRFNIIDSQERPLTYFGVDGLPPFDAITFIPQRDIKLLGFSVYAAFDSFSDPSPDQEPI